MSEEGLEGEDGKVKISPGWCSKSEFYISHCDLNHLVSLQGFNKLKEKLDSRIARSANISGRFQSSPVIRVEVGSSVPPAEAPAWAIEPQFRQSILDHEDMTEESFASSMSNEVESPWELSDSDV